MGTLATAWKSVIDGTLEDLRTRSQEAAEEAAVLAAYAREEGQAVGVPWVPRGRLLKGYSYELKTPRASLSVPLPPTGLPEGLVGWPAGEPCFVYGGPAEAMKSAAAFGVAGRVSGYAVRFGNPYEPDISSMRDFFTPETDFWIKHWGPRPMLYHHGLEPGTADDPIIGTWDTIKVDDVGVWMAGQLDQSHKYWRAIKEMVDQGKLLISTDSAPHLVRRLTMGDGVHRVVRWPIACASLTPSPAEPRLPEVIGA